MGCGRLLIQLRFCENLTKLILEPDLANQGCFRENQGGGHLALRPFVFDLQAFIPFRTDSAMGRIIPYRSVRYALRSWTGYRADDRTPSNNACCAGVRPVSVGSCKPWRPSLSCYSPNATPLSLLICRQMTEPAACPTQARPIESCRPCCSEAQVRRRNVISQPYAIVSQIERVALLVHAQGIDAEDGRLAVALPYPVRGLGID